MRNRFLVLCELASERLNSGKAYRGNLKRDTRAQAKGMAAPGHLDDWRQPQEGPLDPQLRKLDLPLEIDAEGLRATSLRPACFSFKVISSIRIELIAASILNSAFRTLFRGGILKAWLA